VLEDHPQEIPALQNEMRQLRLLAAQCAAIGSDDGEEAKMAVAGVTLQLMACMDYLGTRLLPVFTKGYKTSMHFICSP
jgi:hypothetical protein